MLYIVFLYVYTLISRPKKVLVSRGNTHSSKDVKKEIVCLRLQGKSSIDYSVVLC